MAPSVRSPEPGVRTLVAVGLLGMLVAVPASGSPAAGAGVSAHTVPGVSSAATGPAAAGGPVLQPPPAATTVAGALPAVPIGSAPVVAATYATGLPDGRAAVAVRTALDQIGLPYVWGGNGPTAGHAGFDCSGLTTYSYGVAGVGLPRTAHTQYYAGPLVPAGAPLQPGDLVFYGTAARVHHVGMYIGDGRMVNAPTFGKPVQVAYYRWNGDDYLGASRPAADGGAAPVPVLPAPPPLPGPYPTVFPAPPAPPPVAVPDPRAPQPPEAVTADRARAAAPAPATVRPPAPGTTSAAGLPQVPAAAPGAVPTGPAPSRSAPTHAAPTHAVPTGAVPTGAVPTGAVPTGAVPTGAVPTGAVPTGAVPTGAVPTGAVPTGAAPTGAAPTGAAPAGPRGTSTAPTPTSAAPRPAPQPVRPAPAPVTRPSSPAPATGPAAGGPATGVIVGSTTVPLDAAALGADGAPTTAGIVTTGGRTLVRLASGLAVAPGTVIEVVRPDGTVRTGTVTALAEGTTPGRALAAADGGVVVLLVPTAGGWTAAVAG